MKMKNLEEELKNAKDCLDAAAITRRTLVAEHKGTYLEIAAETVLPQTAMRAYQVCSGDAEYVAEAIHDAEEVLKLYRNEEDFMDVVKVMTKQCTTYREMEQTRNNLRELIYARHERK